MQHSWFPHKKECLSISFKPHFSGQLIRNFNWGPAQPSGGPQHCMYVVGGILGYQWADFHCDFEMNFLCEYQASREGNGPKDMRRN